MIIRVQGSDQNLYEVNLARSTCSCGKVDCSHLAIAADIHINHGKRFRFQVISFAHKTTRTSRLDLAMPWIEAFVSISGIEKVAKYFGKICFEENRSLRLWAQIQNNELPPRELVPTLSRLKEAREPSRIFHHMDWWINSFKKYQCEKESWNEMRLRQVLRSFQEICRLGTKLSTFLRSTKNLSRSSGRKSEHALSAIRTSN